MFAVGTVLFGLRVMLAGLPILVLASTWSFLAFIAVCSKDTDRRKYVLKLGKRVERMIGRLVGEAPQRQPSSTPPTPKPGLSRGLAVVPELLTGAGAEPPRASGRRTAKTKP